MAVALSEVAKLQLEKTTKVPNLVFSIDGIPTKFSIQVVGHKARYGEDSLVYGQSGLVYGGIVAIEDQKDYISISGTTDTITQQVDIDKGAASSSSSITVRLNDFNDEITEIISPGVVVPDVLYRDCEVWVGLNPDITSFPDDYMPLFFGKLTQVKPMPGAIDFTITSSEDVKRADVFISAETTLVQPLYYAAAQIQDIVYSARADVTIPVTVRYISSPFATDTATVTVSGGLIEVAVDPLFTTAKTVKKKVEASEDASQLVVLQITGDRDNLQTTQSDTLLSSTTTAFVEDAKLFILEQDPVVRTYFRVGDELIRYTGVNLSNNSLTGLSRAQLNTFGANHEVGDDVKSFYRLGDGTDDNGNAIDLSLKVMLSGGPQYYKENLVVKSFNYISPSLTVPNALLLAERDPERVYGVTVGDFVTTSGSAIGANNVTLKQITDIVQTDFGAYFVIDGVSFVDESLTTGVVSFNSKYNVLPSGCGVGLSPAQVDVSRFEQINSTYSTSIPAVDLYIKDTIQAKALINDELLFPGAMYSLQRNGRVSVNIIAPPLYNSDSKILDLTTVKNPESLALARGTNKNFYNSIIYRYNEDSIEDKFLNGVVTLSGSSTSRINAPNKPYTIKAKGLRATAETVSLIERNSNRHLQRYQFGAESTPVEVPLSVGMNVEIGDAIIFGDPQFKMSDITQGTRSFKPRVFEVQNKSYNWKTGDIKLLVADTSFSTDVRYGVWSPSSIIGSGSTVDSIIVSNSYGLSSPKKEREKWTAMIGKKVKIHASDYSTTETRTLSAIDPVNPYKFYVEPSLSSAPVAGDIINVANYDDTDSNDNLTKNIYVFWTPTLTVVSGISTTQFTVSVGDAAKLFVGSKVRIHSDDYSVDSGETGFDVSDVTGVTVTISAPLDFTPAVGQKIDLVGFVSDSGKPYGWL
jgi:hypothetical protein